jgi:autotransporter-associated beta strand protein
MRYEKEGSVLYTPASGTAAGIPDYAHCRHSSPYGECMKLLSPVSYCMLIAVLLLLVGNASAATRTWTGGTSTGWDTAANWNPSGVPATGDDVILTGAGTYRPTNQNILLLHLNSLTFDSSTVTAFTVSGYTITLTGSGTTLTVASGAGGHTISCPIVLGASQTWQQNSGSTITADSAIGQPLLSTYGLTKTGTGTLILSGTNTYTGTTTVSEGTLQLGDGTATGHIIPSANLITDNAALTYNTPSAITHAGVISGSGTFTKSGTGTLILSGTNTYTGTTTISDGTLQLGDGITTGNIIPPANSITDNAALRYFTPSAITHAGVISGSGTFTKWGLGTLTLSGANTYTGTTTISLGTLQLGDGTATGTIIPAANLITNDAALTYNTPSVITHAGVISGLGTFTKTGTGTLTLSGANTYIGSTTVSEGELRFTNVNTGISAKTADGGMLAGTGTIPGTVTVADSGMSSLRGGTGSGNTGTLSVNGGLLFSGPSSTLDVTSDGTGLSQISAGTHTITEISGMTVNLLDPMPAGTFTLISASGLLPVTLPTLGTNNSGKNVVFDWQSGTGLTVTLTNPAPAFAGITPDSGLTTGGTPVTIDGTGFVSGPLLDVTIGGNPATGVSVTDATHIAATTPAHAAGSVWVNITSGDGQFVNTTGAYTYVVPSVAISLNQTSIYLPLAAGSTATNRSLGITVSTNAPFTISVADNTGRTEHQGYMGSYTSGTYDVSGAVLTSPLGLAGTANGTTTVQAVSPPITTTPQLLYAGSAAVTSQLLAPNTFSQPVVMKDPSLPYGSAYRTDLIFTIAAA